MVYALLILYFVANAILALSAHLGKLRTTITPPRTTEVVVFFVVSLFVGLPAFAAAWLLNRRHRSTPQNRRQTPVYVFQTRTAGGQGMRAAR